MATMALSGACLLKTGSNVNTKFTGLTAEADWEVLILQAESYINSVTRYNWTDAYSTLNVDVKYILEDAVSCLAAMYAITYEMGGYTSGNEAQTMLDFLHDRVQTLIKELKEIKVRDFVTGA